MTDPVSEDVLTAESFRRFLPLRLLVADDDPLNRFVLESYLEETGIECVFASNGQDALAKLSDQTFDAALIDLRMPLLDGLGFKQAYDAQVATGQRTEIPMASFSAGLAPSGPAAQRFVTHLAKPISFGALWRCLDRLHHAGPSRLKASA